MKKNLRKMKINELPIDEMSVEDMKEWVDINEKKILLPLIVLFCFTPTLFTVILLIGDNTDLVATIFISFFLVFGPTGLVVMGMSELVKKFYDRKMRSKSSKYKEWAEKKDKEENDRTEKERREEAEKKEKERRIRKVRENFFGQLQSAFKGFDLQKICYWCGAEQNFLEYISGIKRGQSYKYMNSDGTPDKRYRDNPINIKFDAKYQCKNCSAEIECRHYSNELPFEDGLVSVGHVTKKGVTQYNETELLRDSKTKKVAKLPDDKDFSDYCNSNNTYFHRPWYV